MAFLARTVVDPVTYKRLAYLLIGAPLGTVWFAALVTLWSLCFGLIVTPLIIPALLALAFATYGFTRVEAELARALLGVRVYAPALPGPGGTLRARLAALFGGGFWRAQAYLWTRCLLGFPAGVLMFGLLGTAVSLILGPLWIAFVPKGNDVFVLHVHTLVISLLLVPVGLALLALTLALAKPLAALFKPIATSMLNDNTADQQRQAAGPARAGLALAGPTRRGLRLHAGVAASVVAVLTVIWAVTSRGYFWPVWLVLPLATAVAMHAWLVELAERPELVRRFHGSTVLASTVGIAGAFWLFTVAVWAVTSHQYFWPIWTAIALAIIVGAETAAVLLGSPNDVEMAERIETLTATRAGAVNAQDSELRRIERDLHDGAQARLVALGMSLGMAEQKLADDPERAGELLSEARAGAEQALRELRDLARGIHPPVLADRGLEAAITALTTATPMHVALSVDVPKRPASAIESAAYFVTAESLANAAKHARADWLDIRIATVGSKLELEIRDDGIGGADPSGGGLSGLRRRVEALDGTLHVTSPPGGPTTIYAELPCV